MKYLFNIPVELASENRVVADAKVSDPKAFEELRARYPDPDSANPKFFVIRTDSEQEQRDGLFDKLKELGRKSPIADIQLACKYPERFYHVHVQLCPSQSEISNAPWLYLATPQPLSLAEFKRIELDDTYVIRKVTTRRKLAFGCTSTVGWMHLFTEAMKDRFVNAALKHALFRPVLLENGCPSGLWQLWSATVMPPKLDYWAGSYMPSVLRYEANLVQDLPEFDVAVAAERAGPAPHNMHRHVIVSQRFRETAEKLAPGQFQFGLIAVGHGEELKRRFTLPELAPPEE